MARERKVIEQQDGSLIYPLVRNRKIPVPGTKGLERRFSENVPQVKASDSVESTLSDVLNVIPGKDDATKLENFVNIVNNGLIKDAESRASNYLNGAVKDIAVVKDFGQLVKASEVMFPGMEASERAQKMLEMSPDLATKLQEAGLELSDSDESEDEDEDE